MYESCGSAGREKFMQFQLMWHRHCSTFLLPNAMIGCDESNSELVRIHERWIGYCDGKSATVNIRNAIMISLTSGVYEHLLSHCNTLQQTISASISGSCPAAEKTSADEDSVYYRFCGAALASMLHARYKKRGTCKSSQKDAINREICILKAIRCSDKGHVPPELRYRDKA